MYIEPNLLLLKGNDCKTKKKKKILENFQINISFKTKEKKKKKKI